MPALSFAGVRIQWPSSRAELSDPVAPLFAGIGESQDAGLHASVNIDLREAQGPPPSPESDPAFRFYMIHGAISVFRPRDEHPSSAPIRRFLLWDGDRRALIDIGAEDTVHIGADIAAADPQANQRFLELALIIAFVALRVYPLHAAALAHPSGVCVLAAGASGAGKSTLALALLDAGYSSLGDDTVFVRADPKHLELWAFARPFHLGLATLSAFPHLEPHARARTSAPNPLEKQAFSPHAAYPSRVLAKLCLHDRGLILLAPRIDTGGPTRAVPMAPADALGQLLSGSAALMLDGLCERETNLKALRSLMAGALCFELFLGSDMLCAPAQTLSHILEPLIREARGKRRAP